MGADPAVDIRPGLWGQLAFPAADFGFQLWVRQTTKKPQHLSMFVAEARATTPRWVRVRFTGSVVGDGRSRVLGSCSGLVAAAERVAEVAIAFGTLLYLGESG